MSDDGTLGVIASLFASTIRMSTPLVFGALAGLVCERSGVINIALEGMMLIGAFAAAVAAYSLHLSFPDFAAFSPWAGLCFASFCGIIIAVVYGVFVIELKANQIVAGTAINLLAVGLAPFLCKILYGSTGATPALPVASRFQMAPVFIAAALIVIASAWLKYMPSGLWLQFSGEHPDSVNSAGIRVNRVRWTAVMLSGALAGIGGASLSIFLSSSFSRNMTAGRGFMALAALIFGKWRPIQTALACLLFGFADALQIRLQGVTLWGETAIPVQFIQILPYLVTVLVLAGVVGKSRAPKALGTTFNE